MVNPENVIQQNKYIFGNKPEGENEEHMSLIKLFTNRNSVVIFTIKQIKMWINARAILTVVAKCLRGMLATL